MQEDGLYLDGAEQEHTLTVELLTVHDVHRLELSRSVRDYIKLLGEPRLLMPSSHEHVAERGRGT